MICGNAVDNNADTETRPQAVHNLVQEGAGKKGGIVWTENFSQDLENVAENCAQAE